MVMTRDPDDWTKNFDAARIKELRAVIDDVACGMPMVQSCRRLGIKLRAVQKMIEKHPTYAQEMEGARLCGADAIADEIIEIADDGRNDWMQNQAGDKVLDAEHVQRSKLRASVRLSLIRAWHPKKYGDRQQIEVVQDTVAERLARAAERLRLAQASPAPAQSNIAETALTAKLRDAGRTAGADEGDDD